MLMLYTTFNMMSKFSYLYNDLIYSLQQLISQPATRRSTAYVGAVGFTIVELLIVIVVIGILVAIVIVTYTGITTRANDTHRAADVDTVRKFLDLYYVRNNHYMKSDHFLNANAANSLASGPLRGLSPEALRGPDATSATVSSWGQWGGDVTSGGMNYSIKTFLADGTSNCVGASHSDSECKHYTIYYKTQENSSFKTLKSYN